MQDSTAVALQYFLPKQALTRLAGWAARREWGRWTTAAICRFVARYRVDLSEAAEPDPAAYRSFNDFFTRPLRAGARPLAAAALVSPVDGAVSHVGPIHGEEMFQAKGHHYTASALLGGDGELAARFRDGDFATIYLSPRDYHRIHMPCAGRLLRMIHVPGDLFSVNPATARGVPGLFARNERVVCIFEAEGEATQGLFALVLVGATIVGSMATVWHGVVNPPRPGHVRAWSYDGNLPGVRLAQGEEMGRFLLGSTVVMLFPPGFLGGSLSFPSDWTSGRAVRLGEAMARAGGESVRLAP